MIVTEGKNVYCCEKEELHEEAIKEVESNLPEDTLLLDLAELYKLFSDFSRVKLLYLLLDRELCVCDITKLMDINQSAVSNHLRLLRNSKLVQFRKVGKNTYYSLADSHVEAILKQGMDHITE